MKVNDELKPLNCPFCKLEVQHHLRGNDYTKSRQYEIKCKNCNLVMIVGAISNNCEQVKKKCIEKWNKRQPDPRLDKALAFIESLAQYEYVADFMYGTNYAEDILKEARELLKELNDEQ